LEAVVFGKAVAQDALLIHVAGGVQAVLDSGGEVFSAVRGRGVDNASAGIHGDVVRQHAQNVPVEKGMLEQGILKRFSRDVSPGLGSYKAALFDSSRRKLIGDDENVRACFDRPIWRLRMEGNCHRRRESPWSRGPDDRRN